MLQDRIIFITEASWLMNRFITIEDGSFLLVCKINTRSMRRWLLSGLFPPLYQCVHFKHASPYWHAQGSLVGIVAECVFRCKAKSIVNQKMQTATSIRLYLLAQGWAVLSESRVGI